MDLTVRNHEIAQKALTGRTYQEIGAEYGITHGRVSQILSSAEMRTVMDEGARRVIALIPKAEQNLAEFLRSDDKSIRWRATKKVLETGGILPGHGMSVTIENLNIDNRQQVINAQVQKALSTAIEGIVGE